MKVQFLLRAVLPMLCVLLVFLASRTHCTRKKTRKVSPSPTRIVNMLIAFMVVQPKTPTVVSPVRKAWNEGRQKVVKLT
jgi:hypothetical protein